MTKLLHSVLAVKISLLLNYSPFLSYDTCSIIKNRSKYYNYVNFASGLQLCDGIKPIKKY